MEKENKKKFLALNGEYFSTFRKAIKNRKEILTFFGDTFAYILTKIYQFFYERFQVIKNARKDIKFAALNNFHLSQQMLKENKITDALFRMHLANLLRKNSPIILYHLAFIYFIKEDIKKARKYANKSLRKRPNFKNAQILLKKIDNYIV